MNLLASIWHLDQYNSYSCWQRNYCSKLAILWNETDLVSHDNFGSTCIVCVNSMLIWTSTKASALDAIDFFCWRRVRRVLYHPLNHNPSTISRVKCNTTTLSGLKYLPLVLDLDSLNFQVLCDRRITQPSVTTNHHCPKVFFWQPEKSQLVLRADLKQWSDQVLRLHAVIARACFMAVLYGHKACTGNYSI